MNKYFFLILTMLFFSFPSMVIGDEVTTDNEILGVVVEWSPLGKSIQIDNYFIAKVPPIYVDSGAEVLAKGSISKITLGSLVKVSLAGKDANGGWLATRIVVLTGEGKRAAFEMASKEKQEVLVQTLERFGDASPDPGPSRVRPKSDTQKKPQLIFKDGVWKN